MNKNNEISSLKKQKFIQVSVVAFFVFLSLCLVSLVLIRKISRYNTDAVIAKDMHMLQQIFQDIDKDCKIIGFDHTKNYIDFLNVKEFVGSQVGAMNVTYPKQWKGPYLNENFSVQDIKYVVLKNKKDYYLVPGDGVVLANGKVIGKDIILDQNSDLEALLQNPEALKSAQGALAVQIKIGGSYVSNELTKPLNYLHMID